MSNKSFYTPTIETSRLATLKQLTALVSGLEVQFDKRGEIRHFTISSSDKLMPISTDKRHLLAEKDPVMLAKTFLKHPTIQALFGKNSQDLVLNCLSPFPFGNRIDFRQIAHIKAINSTLTVRGGFLNIAIDKMGHIFNVTSTLCHTSLSAWPAQMISSSEACTKARTLFAQPIAAVGCQLMLAEHAGALNPVYEVTVQAEQFTKRIVYLLLAETGDVIQSQSVVLQCQVPIAPSPALAMPARSRHSQGNIIWLKPHNVAASALLQTPDHGKPIARQVSDTIIKDLPNPSVLRNKYLVLLMGSKGKPVYARADSSFCYRPSDPEFAAVTTFTSLHNQIRLYLSLGLKTPDSPLFVFVNDRAVPDNAYFNPGQNELHIGVGSGLAHNGLNKHMSFDLGIANHEFGHNVVYLQTPGHDLHGLEGSAIHEAIGDVLGTLVMHYLVKIWYARRFASRFTAANLKADQRIIGSYAAWPNGIRSQRNKKRMPDDFVGEPHNDGLIIGGALADLLTEIATKPNTNLEDQIRLFVEITLMGLALVPADKVSFTDLLRALITADRQTTQGAYRQSIEHCFARHGICLSPAMIIYGKPRRLAA